MIDNTGPNTDPTEDHINTDMALALFWLYNISNGPSTNDITLDAPNACKTRKMYNPTMFAGVAANNILANMKNINGIKYRVFLPP